MHTHWRDCQAWKDYGLPLSTTSNEAAKLFDVTLTQYVGWYDEASYGGMEKSVEDLVKADPTFVMGRVMANGLDLMATGTSIRVNNKLGRDIYDMGVLADSQTITPNELKHVNAVKLWADGQMVQACTVWENILMDNPLDMLALKFAHDSYFYLGLGAPMRDSLGRALPKWKESMPLYGYLMGMYSFGLEETNLYPEAEKVAAKGLEINPRDAWSTHSMAHVLEMMGRQDEGIKFLSGTEGDWTTCGMLSCHNYWHWALHMIEKGDYEGAKGIYDQYIIQSNRKTGQMLDVVDACSLLMRLEMEGVNVGSRYKDMLEIVRPHLDDHVTSFNDNHMLLVLLNSGDQGAADYLMDSIRDFIVRARCDFRDITAEVGLPICEAFMAYKAGDFARAVDLMYPIRYRVWTIGGSHAQRDMYNLFLIHSAMKSSKAQHHKLARFLLTERKSLKSCSPMTDRLIERAMALHD